MPWRTRRAPAANEEATVPRTLLAAAVCAIAIAAVPVHRAAAQQSEVNKRNVVEFYDLAINKKDFAAASKYLGPRYIQHNPTAPDGAEGLKGFIEFLRAKFPESRSEVKRVFADGDYVILHVHSVREPGTRGRAIVDIFRLENGKVVEHWDVIQDIPEKAANANGMF
jgi:predicted SnoaL-like aldol condensation-catalyzing enzyme